jgi:integrase
MSGRRAKILSPADVNDLLTFASCTRHPLRNRVIVLLSAKAGLRAHEIASLTWDMVVGPTGQIGGVIELRDTAAKERQRSDDPNASGSPLRFRKFAPRGSPVRMCRHL